MNKKVFITMLSLCVAFLAGLYILKIFFPQELVIAVENERLIEIGKFIDGNKLLYYIFSGFTAFITYWLYCCACSSKLYLKWYETLEVLAVVIFVRILSFYDNNLATALEHTAFIFLPFIMKSNYKNVVVCFTVHSFSQVLSLGIRNLPMYFADATTLSIIVLAIDVYLWLVICYMLFNNKKKEK